MQERHDQMHLAASMYYVQGETMESIARHLQVSRSTISRLLKEARDSGLVRISLAPGGSGHGSVEQVFHDKFGVRATVVAVREGSSAVHCLERVARMAGLVVSEAVQDEMVIGTAWGTTVASVVQHLRPTDVMGSQVVQLNGSANSNSSGLPHIGVIVGEMARAFDSEFVAFPVPAFFDYAQTKQAMWRERSVRHVLDLQARVELALFGVGSLTSEVPSHVYSAGYLTRDEMLELKAQGVVGDVNTVFLREDGSWADLEINSRASGMPLDQLARVPRRVCVVAGPGKSVALLGALRAGVVTDLVVDAATAKAVLTRA